MSYLNLNGKTVLVTGAAAPLPHGEESIGAAIARELRQVFPTIRLILLARDYTRVNALAESLGEHSTPLFCDVANYRRLEGVLQPYLSELDAVVLAHGCALGVAPFHEGKIEHYNEMLNSNVQGVINTLRITVPHLIRKEFAQVLVMGSIAGHQVYPGGGGYCATKHAVEALDDALRMDTPSNLRVMEIAPGNVHTSLAIKRFEGDLEKADAVYAGYEPLMAQNIANIALFMLTQPRDVSITRLEVLPTAQRAVRQFDKV